MLPPGFTDASAASNSAVLVTLTEFRVAMAASTESDGSVVEGSSLHPTAIPPRRNANTAGLNTKTSDSELSPSLAEGASRSAHVSREARKQGVAQRFKNVSSGRDPTVSDESERGAQDIGDPTSTASAKDRLADRSMKECPTAPSAASRMRCRTCQRAPKQVRS